MAKNYAATLKIELLEECNAMLKHALSGGKKVPAKAVMAFEIIAEKEQENITAEDVQTMAEVHNVLSGIVAPAKPRTLLIMERTKQNSGFWSFLGPVPLIRQLVLAAIFSMVALICLSIFPQVDAETLHKGLLKNQGWSLLLNLLFLLSAAGVGASFSALYKANDYVADGTFDPKYQASYWARLVLGLVAGILMAELLPIPEQALKNGEAGGFMQEDLFKPLMAILGGFSATAVYRILNMLVETVESLVRDKAKGAIAANQRETQAKFAEQDAQNRIDIATKLADMNQQLTSSGASPEVITQMQNMMNDLLPTADNPFKDSAYDFQSNKPEPKPEPAPQTPSNQFSSGYTDTSATPDSGDDGGGNAGNVGGTGGTGGTPLP